MRTPPPSDMAHAAAFVCLAGVIVATQTGNLALAADLVAAGGMLEIAAAKLDRRDATKRPAAPMTAPPELLILDDPNPARGLDRGLLAGDDGGAFVPRRRPFDPSVFASDVIDRLDTGRYPAHDRINGALAEWEPYLAPTRRKFVPSAA